MDFKSFPKKFIELLESCSGSSGTIDSNAGGGDSGNRSTPGDDGPHQARILNGRGDALGMGAPSFLARLETLVSGGFSTFSLVETNPFKELTHLSLKFRSGNDAAIKTYLAARLRQVGWFGFLVYILLCVSPTMS